MLVTSKYECHYCILRVILACFSLLWLKASMWVGVLFASIHTSDMLQTSLQGGDFQVRYSLDLLSLMFKISFIFSKRNIPLISWRQPKATEITFTVWESLEFLQPTSGKEVSNLALRFLLNSPWLLELGR